jgi:hypothetical protein
MHGCPHGLVSNLRTLGVCVRVSGRKGVQDGTIKSRIFEFRMLIQIPGKSMTQFLMTGCHHAYLFRPLFDMQGKVCFILALVVITEKKRQVKHRFFAFLTDSETDLDVIPLGILQVVRKVLFVGFFLHFGCDCFALVKVDSRKASGHSKQSGVTNKSWKNQIIFHMLETWRNC